MDRIYKTDVIDLLETQIKNWNSYANKCILIYGPVGVGKTFSVKYVSIDLDYMLIDYGSEYDGDISQIINNVTTKAWGVNGKIILLDRPYRWMSSSDLKKVLDKAKNPVIIECDEDEVKYYKHLKCFEIRAIPPPKTWVVAQIKALKTVEKPNYRMIDDDVRQALLLAFGSQGYKEVSWLDAVDRYFKQGDVSNLDLSHLPVLLDSASTAFYGLNLYNFISRLVVADLIKDVKILEGISKDFRNYEIRYRYYKKLKELK